MRKDGISTGKEKKEGKKQPGKRKKVPSKAKGKDGGGVKRKGKKRAVEAK